MGNWVTPLYNIDHLRFKSAKDDLIVCSECGKGFRATRVNKFNAHVKKKHAGTVRKLKGKGIIARRSRTLVTELNDKNLEAKVRLMQKGRQVVDIKEEIDDDETISPSIKLVNFDETEVEPYPTTKPAQYYDFTKPSDFDLGLWKYGTDISNEALKKAFDLIKPAENKFEKVLVASTLFLLETARDLLPETPAGTLLKLTATRVRRREENIQADTDDDQFAESRRNFGQVLPETLERYSSQVVGLVLGLFRMVKAQQKESTRLKMVKTLTEKIKLEEEFKDEIKKIANIILPFIVAVLLQEPTLILDPPMLFLLKGLQVKLVKDANNADEESYQLLPPGKMSTRLAAVRYCLLSLILVDYWSKENSPSKRKKLLDDWSTSATFNGINKLIYESRKYTVPADPAKKPTLTYVEGQDLPIIQLRYGLKLTIQNLRDVRHLLIDKVRKAINEVFDHLKSAIYLKDDKKFKVRQDKVTFEGAPLTLEAIMNHLKPDFKSKSTDVKKVELLNIRGLILTLCAISASGCRRGAEYRDLRYSSHKTIHKRNVFICPDGVSLYDSRVIGKRPGAFTIAGRLSRIYHDVTSSHFMGFMIVFVNPLLKDMCDIEAAAYLVFPLEKKPKRALFQKQYEALLSFDDSSADESSVFEENRFSKDSFSKKYLNIINGNLTELYNEQLVEITHQTYRQIISSLQEHVMLKSGKSSWKEFLSSMEKKTVKDYFSNMNGHSSQTSMTFYRGTGVHVRRHRNKRHHSARMGRFPNVPLHHIWHASNHGDYDRKNTNEH